MTRGEKLLRDTMLYGVAHFGSKILAFLAIPLYTHYFTTKEYGTWDIYQVTIALLIPFITFELTAATYRWLIEETDHEKRQVIITTGAFSIIRQMIVFNIAASLFIYFIKIPYSWLTLVIINLEILNSFLQQCARALGHHLLFATIGFIQTFTMIASLLTFMYLYHFRLEAFFYATIIAGVVILIITALALNVRKYIIHSSYSQRKKKSFLKYSLPIIPAAASWWLMTMSDRYFITLFLTVEANGIFAIANKVPAIILMLNTIFFLAWKDNAILEYEAIDKDDYYSNVFKHFFRMMTTSIICLILLAKPIIKLVIASNFYDAWQYTGILLVGSLFHTFSLFWTAGYHGAKSTKNIFSTSIVGAIVNIVVNLLFIKIIGLYAVALSTVVAFLAVWILRIRSSEKHFNIQLPIRDIIVLFPLVIIAIIMSFIFSEINILLAAFISGIIFLLYNRGIILFVIKEGWGKVRR